MDYQLFGYDEDGVQIVNQFLDAVDDEDAVERAQETLATGGFDHCAEVYLCRLSFVCSLITPDP